jgi:thioredoxin reductase (NADPH)
MENQNIINCDVAIIGAGPTGCTAAIYTSRANLNTYLIEGEASDIIRQGGQLTTTDEVENYPGYKSINGTDLVMNMRDQASQTDTKILPVTIERVNFSNSKDLKLYYNNNCINAKSIIIATGAVANKLEFKNSQKFWNNGISACAVCDGALPIFRNNPLVVIGGGDSAMEEATFLTKFASKVYIIHRRDTLRASSIMQERAKKNKKIKILYNYEVIEAQGDELLESVIIKSTLDKKKRKIMVKGLFFAIGHTPMSSIFSEYINTDDEKYILTDGECTKTNIPGVFAAGDVKDKKWRQAITAAGSGCIAALQVEEYLNSL